MKIKRYSKRSIMLCLSTLLFIVILSISFKVYMIGSYTSADSIIVEALEFDDYYMKMSGNTINSALGYSSYKLKRSENTLYIKFRYSLVSIFNPLGKFEIEDGGPFEGITKVYIMGLDEKDLRLIWGR